MSFIVSISDSEFISILSELKTAGYVLHILGHKDGSPGALGTYDIDKRIIIRSDYDDAMIISIILNIHVEYKSLVNKSSIVLNTIWDNI